MTKERWSSIWHQLAEISLLKPESVLEVGPGTNLFKTVSLSFQIPVKTIDHNPAIKPDFVGSITDLPFKDNAYDVVCAFQVLEHLPYENSIDAFREMVRTSRRNVVISLPDAKIMWRFRIKLPMFGEHDFLVNRPSLKLPMHKFDGEHYWEINTKGYNLEKVLYDMTQISRLVRTYRIYDNPYHRFFVFENH
jgi:predicted SAM-dependent methyltransferase